MLARVFGVKFCIALGRSKHAVLGCAACCWPTGLIALVGVNCESQRRGSKCEDLKLRQLVKIIECRSEARNVLT